MVRHELLLVPLLLAACSFNGSGLPPRDGSRDVRVADLKGADLSRPDARVADLKGADLVSRPDALPDMAPDGVKPCVPNPCLNGGTCVQGLCKCATGFDGPTCAKCSLGHTGASCAACTSAKLTIQTCAHATLACGLWIDGNNTTMTTNQCPSASGCFATDVDFDLGFRRFVHRIRFLSDWWSKRPGTWELLASDNNVDFSLVMSARSNNAPWQCVTDEPCTTEVPTECCPGGVKQDTSGVGTMYPKWDDFTFSGVTARYWRFRIQTTDDLDHLIMRELELYGHDCLGELACATSSCGKGVCTGQEATLCTCASCQATASCSSAFTGVAPPCTTP